MKKKRGRPVKIFENGKSATENNTFMAVDIDVKDKIKQIAANKHMTIKGFLEYIVKKYSIKNKEK